MLPSDESKLASGGVAGSRMGDVFRCLVRSTHFCLEVWNFRSERAELTIKGGYSA